MSVRDQNLQTIGFLTATFKIHQTGGVDDLKDDDVGKAVTITGDYEVGPGSDGNILLGKLISLSLTDADVGKRVATVQIGGICTLGRQPGGGQRQRVGKTGARPGRRRSRRR